MVEPMDTLAARDKKACVFVGPAQSGKALTLDTPIRTPHGWTTMGEVRVGDIVFSIDGKTTRVVCESPVMHGRDCYEVMFDDGTSIRCDAEHEWSVCDINKKDRYKLHTHTTQVLAETYRKAAGSRARYSIPNCAPLDMPEAELPIEPYLLGVWLGDGTASLGRISAGLKDAQGLLDSLTQRGHEVRVSGHSGNARGTTFIFNVEGLRGSLRDADLKNNKHIPSKYLQASVEQRRELLRGLIDTDGHVTKDGLVKFSSASRKMFNEVLELVRSLGYKPKEREVTTKSSFVKKGYSTAFELVFIPERGADIATLERHKNRADLAKRRPGQTTRRFIVDIHQVESVPVKCIGVDNPSHLFLAGEQMVPTHNTQGLILNWLAYTVAVDPMDMIIYSPTKGAARDLGMRRVDRLHRDSKMIGSRLLKKRDADNKFDKLYDSGIMLTLSHPSVTEFAGRPIARVALTDYDRMDDDIGGDGAPFDLASKRTTTFGSFAMTLAESSPSKPITDPKYIPQTKHEAPPANGILGLYNRGDRRRRYWPCPSCDEYFEAKFDMLEWDRKAPNVVEAGESVRLVCPHCGYKIHPDQRNEMDMWGVWVKDGQRVDSDGKIHGPDPRTDIASFWLNGLAAAFINWRELVKNYIIADEEYQRTGSEESLKKFYNNDLGEPYLPKSMESERLPEVLKSRAEPLPVSEEPNTEEMVQRYVSGDRDVITPLVPKDVRFLVATVDVQKNMFVVQVFGIRPGEPFDSVMIDRFSIVKSRRIDESGDHLWVKPGTYLDDWDRITEEVLDRSYELCDGSGRRMMIKMTGCDSGGREGVTTNAYNYYRKLKKEGMAGRFHLLKGEHAPGAPRTRISFPDSNRRDKFAVARGDVPVLMVHSNALKDTLANRLESTVPGKGMFVTPDWMPDFVYSELCAEVRTVKGWENPLSSRNEAWDLSYYMVGLCVSPLVRIEQMDWENPQGWAAPWDENSLITAPFNNKRFAHEPKNSYDFGKLAGNLA